MPNIVADKFMADKFHDMLSTCQRESGLMTDWEQTFVKSMADKRDANQMSWDLGVPHDKLWNPTSNQWNTLKLLAEKYA